MARVVFVALLLANVGYYVWAAGLLGGGDEGREPERLKQQMEPARLKVTLGDEQAPQPSAPAAVAAPADFCRRVGPMTATEAETLKQSIAAQGGSATTTSVDEQSYWVVIPAVHGKIADKEVARLKEAGIKDFFIVNDEGENHNAISLGLFHKEDAAKELVQQLKKKGIKSAKVGAKSRASGTVLMDVRGDTTKLSPLLAAQAFAVGECPKE